MAKLRAKISAVHQRLGALDPAFKRAAVVVMKAATDRIKSQGGGQWPPTAEQSKGAPFQRTGRLAASLTIGGTGNVLRDIPGGIRVGTNLQSESGFDYPRALQEGTGIYGPSGQPITPKDGKYLVFQLNGRTIFTRSVKGSPGRPFLYVDENVSDTVRTVFANFVMRGRTRE